MFQGWAGPIWWTLLHTRPAYMLGNPVKFTNCVPKPSSCTPKRAGWLYGVPRVPRCPPGASWRGAVQRATPKVEYQEHWWKGIEFLWHLFKFRLVCWGRWEGKFSKSNFKVRSNLADIWWSVLSNRVFRSFRKELCFRINSVYFIRTR